MMSAAAATAAAMTASRPPWCRPSVGLAAGSASLVEGFVLNEREHATERAESASLGYARSSDSAGAPAALQSWEVPPGALGYGPHDGPFRACGGRLLFATRSRVVSAAVCAASSSADRKRSRDA